MAKEEKPELRLDRRAHEALVDALSEGGKLRRLVEFRNTRQELWDLQFRRKSGASSLVSLYGGMTTVLDLHVRTGKGSADPQFRYEIQDPKNRDAAPASYITWAEWQSSSHLSRLWPEVKAYLLGRKRWLLREEGARHFIEGRVHALLCSDAVGSFKVINREASPVFRNKGTRLEIIGAIRKAIDAHLAGVPDRPKWLTSKNFDASPDLLGVDRKGRLLVIEAKPPEYTSGIVKGPIQAAMYAGLIATWLRRDPEASSLLEEMLRQRVDAGLSKGPVPSFASDMPVVPVLAIGVGSVSKETMAHARAFREALAGFQPAPSLFTEPIEIWRLGVVEKKI